MKLPVPREELIELVASSFDDKPIPIRMLDWRDRHWLAKQDDETLLRCFVETAEFRLNPTKSTEFFEPGISPAERRARAIEFVTSIPVGDLQRFTVELIEQAFIADMALEGERDWRVAAHDLAAAISQAWKDSELRRKERSRAGALAKISNDSSQRAKKLAQTLWPDAHKHGWTADKLHREITARGEYASAGRVAKWLTNLRKTGRC